MSLLLSKTGDARFLGHLDFGRLVERSLRRSGLPVRSTEGFNPHLKVTFADALPVGVASQGEWITVTFNEELAPPDVRARLAPALPRAVELVDVRRGVPGAGDGSVSYRLDVEDGVGSAASALDTLLARDTFLVEDPRKKRPLDVRPFLVSAEVAPISDPAGGGELIVRLVAVDGKPPRPGPLVQALRALAEERGDHVPRFGTATKLAAEERHGETSWHDVAAPDRRGASSSSTLERPKRAASPS